MSRIPTPIRPPTELIDNGVIDQQINEYKQFAFKDNMFKMAIAFILGASFGKLVTSVSDNLLMPIIKWITSFAGETWREAVWKPLPGMVIETGKFAAAFMDFALTSLTLFVIYKMLLSMGIMWDAPDTAIPGTAPIQNKNIPSTSIFSKYGWFITTIVVVSLCWLIFMSLCLVKQ